MSKNTNKVGILTVMTRFKLEAERVQFDSTTIKNKAIQNKINEILDSLDNISLSKLDSLDNTSLKKIVKLIIQIGDELVDIEVACYAIQVKNIKEKIKKFL